MGAKSDALSSVHQAELLLFFILLQLAVIVVAGRIGSFLAVRWGQAAAVGEIVVGIVLGPTLFGWLFPGAFEYVFHSVSGSKRLSHRAGTPACVTTGPASCCAF